MFCVIFPKITAFLTTTRVPSADPDTICIYMVRVICTLAVATNNMKTLQDL